MSSFYNFVVRRDIEQSEGIRSGIAKAAMTVPFVLGSYGCNPEKIDSNSPKPTIIQQPHASQIAQNKQAEKDEPTQLTEPTGTNNIEVKSNVFDYPDFIEHLKDVEGVKPKIYDDGAGNMTIGIGHLMKNNDENLFKALFGNKFNYKAVLAGNPLSPSQIDKLAAYDINIHMDRAKTRFPSFSDYPYYLQKALLDSIYRGDMGKIAAGLINSGDFKKAAIEYLNRRDYKNAVRNGLAGIRPRMEANRDAMLRYATELEEEQIRQIHSRNK